MAKTHPNGRAGGGAARQRSVAAAARAASKRAEKARAAERASVVAGRTVVVGTEADTGSGTGNDIDSAAESGSVADPPVRKRTPEKGAEPAPEPAKPERAEPAEGSGPAEGSEPAERSAGTGRKGDGAAADAKKKTPTRRPTAGAPWGRSRLFHGLLAVVTLAALTAAALLGWEYRQADLTDQARAEATDVAREVAPKILSYDHRHLERDFEDARAHLTGSFRKEFSTTTEKVVTPTAEKYDGVVKATVAKPPGGGAPAVSVVSASPDQVVVLMFMNQVTESKKLDKPRMDLNRVRMTLVDTSGGWKVSAVDAL